MEDEITINKTRYISEDKVARDLKEIQDRLKNYNL
jgi:hypothetical protein